MAITRLETSVVGNSFYVWLLDNLPIGKVLAIPIMRLKVNANKMYHLGIGDVVAISAIITRANESRSYLIYEELAMLLIKEAKQLYFDDDHLEVTLKGNIFGYVSSERKGAEVEIANL